MRKIYLIIFCFSFGFLSAQNNLDSMAVKENPIVYGNFMIGGAGGQVGGVALILDLNYQNNKDLITLRSNYMYWKRDPNIIESILIFPLFFDGDTVNEFSLLYGKRFVYDGTSLSISAGVSTNLVKFKETINNERITSRKSYIGVPFEVNFSFFNKERKRYRVLANLIPVGKPTSFGKSIGFKLFGNLGDYNYCGFGINFGLGWHKKY